MNHGADPNWDGDLFRMYDRRMHGGGDSWQDDFADAASGRDSNPWDSSPERPASPADYSSRGLFGGPGADLFGSGYADDSPAISDSPAASDSVYDQVLNMSGHSAGGSSGGSASRGPGTGGAGSQPNGAGSAGTSGAGRSRPGTPSPRSRPSSTGPNPHTGSIPPISQPLPAVSGSMPAVSGSMPSVSDSSSGSGSLPPIPSAPSEYRMDDTGSLVRPYARTKGRTRTDYDLAIETLVSTSDRGSHASPATPEHRSICGLCTEARSVAEIAAHLRLPLGVVRVLVGDMAGLGLLLIHESGMVVGDRPSMEFLERVLSGLRKL